MKIYCILFDTCNYDKNLFNFFDKNKINYKPMITNSFTTTSLVSAFSGLLPSEISENGIGWDSCYVSKNEKEKSIWNSKIAFNKIPKSWKMEIYGDRNNYKFITNNCCKIDIEYEEKIHTNYGDEIEILKSLQKKRCENTIFFIKYNHYHDSQSAKSIQKLSDIFTNIDFEEKEAFFWIFSDHGYWGEIDKFMKPPHSSIGWNIVVNNIDNFEDTRRVTHVSDLYHYIMKFANNAEPKFAEKYYYCEDGRASISPKSTSTFSVIENINESSLLQMSYHRGFVKVYFYNVDERKIKQSLYLEFDKIKQQKLLALKNKLLEKYGDRINDERD